MPITRLTFSSQQLMLRQNLERVQKQYQAASVAATTGQKLNFLSDDPTKTSRLFSLQSRASEGTQFQRNIDVANSRLGFTDARLTEARATLESIRDIALRGNDPTLSDEDRAQLVSQIADLKESLLGTANSKIDGRYIFAGTATDTLPFSGTPVVFNGNSNTINIQVSGSLQVPINIDADAVFTGAGGGEDLFDIIDDLSADITNEDTINFDLDFARLDAGIKQVAEANATVSIHQQQLDILQTSFDDDSVRILSELSDVRDADVDKAIAELISKETALNLVFTSSSRILSVLGQLSLQ